MNVRIIFTIVLGLVLVGSGGQAFAAPPNHIPPNPALNNGSGPVPAAISNQSHITPVPLTVELLPLQTGPAYYARQYLNGLGAHDYTLTAITEHYVAATFPDLTFFQLVFRQYPVAVEPPDGLNPSDVLVVQGDLVFVLTDPDVMKQFFLGWVAPAQDDNDAIDIGNTWLRLTEVYSQDGFFTFSEPLVHMITGPTGVVAGEVDVTDGGMGAIQVMLNFENGILTDIMEVRDVEPGPRPL